MPVHPSRVPVSLGVRCGALRRGEAALGSPAGLPLRDGTPGLLARRGVDARTRTASDPGRDVRSVATARGRARAREPVPTLAHRPRHRHRAVPCGPSPQRPVIIAVRGESPAALSGAGLQACEARLKPCPTDVYTTEPRFCRVGSDDANAAVRRVLSRHAQPDRRVDTASP